MFKLTLDDLLRKDLSEVKGNYIAKRRAQKLASGRTDIPFVPVKAAAGYLTGYADPEFIDELNTFTLPMLTGGDYRAFEIIGDSMMPTPSGSVIVGEKVNDLEEVKNNNTYVIVSKTDGIVYKRMLKNNRQKNRYMIMRGASGSASTGVLPSARRSTANRASRDSTIIPCANTFRFGGIS
jgi:hypothetical protein